MTAASIRRKLPVAAVAALAFAIPSAAQATVLHCGETVRKDVKLNADLDCSAGGAGGLVIGKDGVTVDLNHHSVIGAGGADGYEGIENDGYNDVTIENGTVTGFQDQLLLNDVVHNTITHVYLKAPGFDYWNGILMNYGTGNQILDNKFSNAQYSLQSENGSANTIADNTFNKGTYGLYTQAETADRIIGNTSAGFFSTNGFYSSNDVGSVYRDDAANGGNQGFYFTAPNNIKIKGAKANHNVTSGIYLDSTVPSSQWSAGIWNSTANDNGNYGIYAAYPVQSSGNTALRNALHNCNLVRCNG